MSALRGSDSTATVPPAAAPASEPGVQHHNLLVMALRNALAISWFGDGVEPREATPSEVVYDEPHALVRRIAPHPDQAGNPVLLVTPLAVPTTCWDLRPGQSLAAHLAGAEPTSSPGAGRPTYVIDYGHIGFADRRMGFEDWVDGILSTAVERISAAHDGAPVHLIGWSHGGTMSLLLGAHAPDLPIASIATLGTPTDYALNPAYAGVRLADRALGTALMLAPTALLGGVPARLTRLGYRALAPMRELAKPWTLATNLHRPEILARIDAVDRFMDAMPGYPARFFHQSLVRLVIERELATGTVHLSDEVVIRMDELRAPLLLIGSDADVLALAPSVEAGVRAYHNAQVDYLEVSELSHLGLIASPRARETTWPALQRHLAAHD